MTQRVLITAGADGIGLEIAKSFLKNNAQVWVTDINQDAINDLPDGIQGSCLDVVDPNNFLEFHQGDHLWRLD